MIKKKNNGAEWKKKESTARYLDLNERLARKATVRHLVHVSGVDQTNADSFVQ